MAEQNNIQKIRDAKVDQYHAAATVAHPNPTPVTDQMSKRERAEAYKSHPATRPMILLAVSLAYDGFPGVQRSEEEQKQLRINTLSALKRGVSKTHCGVLIDKLKGTFPEHLDRPHPPQTPEPAMASVGSDARTESDDTPEYADVDRLPWD